MRIRIGVILAYLLLGCILLEDALPYFAQANSMECCEYSSECGGKEGKKQKDFEEFKLLHEKSGLSALLSRLEDAPTLNILIASERIPDSAHLSIFSPPPNQV